MVLRSGPSTPTAHRELDTGKRGFRRGATRWRAGMRLTLHEKVRPGVGGLRPLAHDVVKSQVELVEREHLKQRLQSARGASRLTTAATRPLSPSARC